MSGSGNGKKKKVAKVATAAAGSAGSAGVAGFAVGGPMMGAVAGAMGGVIGGVAGIRYLRSSPSMEPEPETSQESSSLLGCFGDFKLKSKTVIEG